jgi:feruloyl esterase
MKALMIRRAAVVVAVATAAAGCASRSPSLADDPQGACALLIETIPAARIGIPSGAATIESATLVAASELRVAEGGPTPASTITPALPVHCRVIGKIAPLDPAAPPISFQVNLPTRWNGRAVQYGGGGFNGVLITGLALPPSMPYDLPVPLSRGFVTYGTDSGHRTQPGTPPQAFATNEEALVNFAHASYKKVRDVAVALTTRAYGRAPQRIYFVGSSEGGREGLTMAQRYPEDFDGIFSRVPVINWTGLQHAGTRNGIATMGDAWIRPAQVKLVHEAVLKACDAADGLQDGLVSDAVGCRARFDVASLRCKGNARGDSCLSDAQVRAVRILHGPYRFEFALANGVQEYPGWGVSGEALPASGPTGGWSAWWLGSTSPTLPPQPTNSIAWIYGSGAIQYFYARDPSFDVRRFEPNKFADRIRQVSALMDSTDPDLSAFHRRGGKLIILENMADYAQSPYAGIQYYDSVVARMGKATTDQFLRLYTAPGVDHVGSGAPANIDMLSVLTDWVEDGKPPEGLQLLEQELKPPFAIRRARPLCHWPGWPRYRGSGNPMQAESFECAGPAAAAPTGGRRN